MIRRLLAGTAVGHDLVRKLLTVVQRRQAGTFDGADVHEHILAAVIRLDEAVALGGVEPLHCSLAHKTTLSLAWMGAARLRMPGRSKFWKEVVSADTADTG